MSRTYDVTVAFTGKIVLSDKGVTEYVDAIKEAEGQLPGFREVLLKYIEQGNTDAALAALFKNGLRDAVRDLTVQLNDELKQDASSFKAAPALVTVTTHLA